MRALLERLLRWLRSLLPAWRRAPATAPDLDQWLDESYHHPVRSIDYKLFIPAKGTGTPRPLVLMLHGCKQDPQDFATGTRMNVLAREQGVLVLYPAQTRGSNVGKCWNWFHPSHQQRELGEPAMLAALTRSVMDTRGVDPDRVYVAGLSAGAAMACILGRTHSDLFAALGVHSGLRYRAAIGLMSALGAMKHGGVGHALPGPAVPTIVFHGDADGTVHPSNGDQLVNAALADWQDLKLLPGETNVEPAVRASTRKAYADAQGRVQVEHWVLHGGGHAWSGGSADGSFTDPEGPDASAEMLRFFAEHPKHDLQTS